MLDTLSFLGGWAFVFGEEVLPCGFDVPRLGGAQCEDLREVGIVRRQEE
jgi:hypothetical protein